MRRSHNNLILCLKEAGIQPKSLALFIDYSLTLNQKHPPKFKSNTASIYHDAMIARAELFLTLIASF